jgi:formylglycine-generating enzyme required for sulfatase activity
MRVNPAALRVAIALVGLAMVVGFDASAVADTADGMASSFAQTRAQRFSAWQATHADVSERIKRALAQTSKLVSAYRARPETEREDPRANPVIFRTEDAGMTIWDCAECPQLALVPAGAYTIGSPADEADRGKDEGPQKRITLLRPFAVGRFEVTRGEYDAFLRATGRPIQGGCVTDRIKPGTWAVDAATNLRDPGFAQDDEHPVVCVSWHDAQAYVDWLRARTGRSYRLLSEAEWEYVARAGTTSTYPWGPSADTGCEDANLGDTTFRKKYGAIVQGYPTALCSDGWLNTAPVGSYRANAFGLHDLLGNVGEWIRDCATISYATLPTDGTADLSGDCARHMVRSGSWGAQNSDARVANRIRYPATQVDDSIGIRVAKDLDE